MLFVHLSQLFFLGNKFFSRFYGGLHFISLKNRSYVVSSGSQTCPWTFICDFCVMSSVFHQAFYLDRDICTLFVLAIFLFSTIDTMFYFFFQLINIIFLAYIIEIKSSPGNYYFFSSLSIAVQKHACLYNKVTRETINISTIAVIHYFS